MGELFVIRHGQSTWNAEDRWQGQADPPLTEAGRASAQRLAQELAAYGFAMVATSDLERARQTAEILVRELALPSPTIVSELRERDVGEWTGKTSVEIERSWPGWVKRWRREELVSLPGGESRDAFDRRVLGALANICRSAGDDEKVLVVAHAGTLRALQRHAGMVSRSRHNLHGVWVGLDGGVLRCRETHSPAGPP